MNSAKRLLRKVLAGPLAVSAWVLPLWAQAVEGAVVDSAGQPLAGVRVQVVGIRRAVETDADGRFRIPRVREHRLWLVADRPGYRSTIAIQPLAQAGPTMVTLTLLPFLARSIDSSPAIHPGLQARVNEALRDWRGHATGRYFAAEGWDRPGRESLGDFIRDAIRVQPSQPTWWAPDRDGTEFAVTPQSQSPYATPETPPPALDSPNRPLPPVPTSYLYAAPPPVYQLPASSWVHSRDGGAFSDCSPAVSIAGDAVRPDQDADDYDLATFRAVEVFPGISAAKPWAGTTDKALLARLQCGVVVVWPKR